MAEAKAKMGTIAWVDLTVADAPKVRDFYKQVIGWEPSPVKMGDYDDYNMVAPSTEKPAAGICHARGGNAKIPPQWMVYVTVEDLESSIKTCQKMGGKLVARLGKTMCIIQDPAGAVMGLMQGS